MSKPLYAFSGLLQKVLCCCFSSSKSDKKTDDIIEDDQFDDTQFVTTQNMRYVSGQRISSTRLQRPIVLENIYTKRDYPVNGMESTIINDKRTSKCKFCNRCKSYQDDFDKDKAK